MKKIKKPLRSIFLEMVIYAVLATVYFFLVLHFLGHWIKEIYDSNKVVYAIVALLLIIGQGVVLEMVTTRLLELVRSKTK